MNNHKKKHIFPEEIQPGTHLEGRICFLDHFHGSGGFGLGRLDDRTIDDGDLVGFITRRDDDVDLFPFGNAKDGGVFTIHVDVAHVVGRSKMIDYCCYWLQKYRKKVKIVRNNFKQTQSEHKC